MVNNSALIARDLAKNPWTWPGGYPRYATTRDGCCLCSDCCGAEEALIAVAERDGDVQWELVATDINWESRMYCDHCGEEIPSAYPVQD